MKINKKEAGIGPFFLKKKSGDRYWPLGCWYEKLPELHEKL